MSGWVAGAIVVGSVASGVIGSNAAKSAANAQTQAADASTAEQRRQYDQTRQDWAPWRSSGEGALNRLNAASTGDMSSFYNDPSYSFTRSEGMRGIEQTNAARGGGRGGNALKALADYNQNIASRQYGDWWNRQSGLAGLGQTATSATTNAGTNASNNISNNLMAAGDARASGVMGAANSWTNSLNTGLNTGLLYSGGYFGNMGKSNSQMAPGSGWLRSYGTGWMKY